MPKELSIKDNKLIITIPLTVGTYDCDLESEENPNGFAGYKSNIVGLYRDHKDNGIAIAIHIAGKPITCEDYIYKLNGSKKEFENLCKTLNLDIHYTEDCQI